MMEGVLRVYTIVKIDPRDLSVHSTERYLSRDVGKVDNLLERYHWGSRYTYHVTSVRDATPDDIGKWGYAL